MKNNDRARLFCVRRYAEQPLLHDKAGRTRLPRDLISGRMKEKHENNKTNRKNCDITKEAVQPYVRLQGRNSYKDIIHDNCEDISCNLEE